MSASQIVTLISSEGDKVVVSREAALLSGVIRNIFEESGDVNEAIPIPKVKTRILEKIVEYCQYHVKNPPIEIPQPLRTANLADVVSDWDNNFINLDKETLFELILAENFLDIKPLLELSCAKVASLIKGKSPEQIRKDFNIINDFTPEEERQVK